MATANIGSPIETKNSLRVISPTKALHSQLQLFDVIQFPSLPKPESNPYPIYNLHSCITPTQNL